MLGHYYIFKFGNITKIANFKLLKLANNGGDDAYKLVR